MYTVSPALLREKTRSQTGTFVVLLLAVVIGFFFTQDQYYSYIANQDTVSQAHAENTKKEKTLSDLNVLEKKVSSDTALRDSLDRYAGTFREDTVIDSLFAPQSDISISEVSIGRGDKLPNGLSMADISVSLRAGNTLSLLNFLDYLTNKTDNKRSYVIKSLSFPLDTSADGPQDVSLSLGMYYFDAGK